MDNFDLDWSQKQKLPDGRYVEEAELNKNNSELFWSVWREQKTALKKSGYAVSKNDDDVWIVKRYSDDLDILEKSQAVDSDKNYPVPAGLDYYGYQKAGIEYCLDKDNILIGDEMGLGKTVQAIGVINVNKPKDVLIVSPASLKLNWKKELETWLVDKREVQVIMSGKDNLDEKQDIVIVNYDVLQKYQELLDKKWSLVIMDEVHYLKNPDAQRTKAALSVQADKKIMLTGTPIPNRPIEIQAVAGYLDDKSFGNRFGFGKRYASLHKKQVTRNKSVWDWSGASNLDELQRRLRQSFMIRRKKDEVLKDLPAKVKQIIELPYESYKKEIKAEYSAFEDYNNKNKNPNVDPYSLDADQFSTSIDFASMSSQRKATAEKKVKAVVEHLESFNEPVVVMAHHRDVIAQLEAELIKQDKKVVVLTGEKNQVERNEAVEAFQSGQADVFIGSIKAAGVGLTLTRASKMVFAELDWVPSDIAQAEDRIHRIGQESSVLIQYIVVESSLDAVFAKKIVDKTKVAARALDDVVVEKKIEIPELIEENKELNKVIKKAKVKVKANQIAESLSLEKVELLQKFMKFLASRCDGALAQDGVGFNGVDKDFGASLARQNSWSMAQQKIAYKMLKKYKRQIEELDDEGYNSLYE
tara:strand:- start:2854 stop:4776 length:1923 start_codon:yes stop_codon:yes gene_type:complete